MSRANPAAMRSMAVAHTSFRRPLRGSSIGVVHVCGPLDNEEKARWDRHLEHREDAQAYASHCAAKYRNAEEPQFKSAFLEQWKEAQEAFYKIDDNLPPRYRKILKDRCFLEGAV